MFYEFQKIRIPNLYPSQHKNFMAALFVIKNWKKTNVINRKDKWYIYTMEYHIAMKRNAFHETTWMNITYIIWSQRNQTQRSIQCEIPLI